MSERITAANLDEVIKRNEVIEEQMKQSASLIWSKYNPMQINSPIQLALQILRPHGLIQLPIDNRYLSGAIFVRDGKRIPLINTALPRANQYFTAWHEIYHLLFDEVSFDHLIESEILMEERKAEYFAALMLLGNLMPYFEVLKDMEFQAKAFQCMNAFQAPYKAVLISLYESAVKNGNTAIAEEHAVTFAAGQAIGGLKPVVCIYSTFLQRSYDQIMQDVAMLHLHVVFAIDRAGLVGDDGPTHHGVFDVGFLRQMPGMLLLAPASLSEQQRMLCWAVEKYNGPVAVRYPRGGQGEYTDCAWNDDVPGLCVHRQGGDVLLVTYGTLVNNLLTAAEMLEKEGIHAGVLRLMNLTQFPTEAILTRPVYGIDLGPDFVPHGSQEKLYRLCGLDSSAIAEFVRGVIPR